ncbi:MAG TPA: ERF family protein, partial [Negativicutes bacterium]
EPSGNGQDITISTILLHNSGEWMEFEPLTLKAVKADPQGAGSAITYGRRYALSSILGVAWDEDDDGNKASQGGSKEKQSAKTQTPTPSQKTAPPPNTGVTDEDKVLRSKMLALVKELGIAGEMKVIIPSLFIGVEDSKHLSADQVKELVEYLEMRKHEAATADDATLNDALNGGVK